MAFSQGRIFYANRLPVLFRNEKRKLRRGVGMGEMVISGYVWFGLLCCGGLVVDDGNNRSFEMYLGA